MKRWYFLIMIMLVGFPSILHGQGDEYDEYSQEETTPHFNIDFEAIRLKPPLTEDHELKSQCHALTMELEKTFSQYDETAMKNIVNFIAAHPSDNAALTAKYYLAEYLLAGRVRLEENMELELAQLVVEDMLRLFAAIASEVPETWQGKLASYFTPEYFDSMLETGEYYRTKRRELWPLLRQLETNPEFRKFQSFRNQIDPVELIIGTEYIEFALKEGDILAAEAELARLKTTYSYSWKIKYAEKAIAEAYEDQFDGGLTGATDDTIFYFLTSSKDFLEVKQAAAALGNFQMIGTFELNATKKKIIDSVMLSYIDRAMSGNANEQTEMIDLIYRLWGLAVPALLDALNSDDPARAAFAGERLLYMRNEEIITDIIDNARATTNNTKRAELIGLLTRMNEPCVSVMRFRGCLPDEQLQELYQRLVVPAIQELQASSSTTMP